MAQYPGTHTLSNQFQWLKLSFRRNQISDWLWLCVKVSIDSTKKSYLIICKPNNNKKMQNDINKTKKTHAVFLPFSIASDWLTFFFDWIRIQITAYSSSSNKWSLQWYGQLVLCLQKIAILWLTCVSVCIKWYNRNKIDQMKRRACVMVPTNQRYPFTHSESFLSFFRHIADFMKLPERPFHSPHSYSFFNFRTKEIPIYIYILNAPIKCITNAFHMFFAASLWFNIVHFFMRNRQSDFME